MPAFVSKGSAQFSDEEGNRSRLVTKARWVVESFNGRLKKWQYLDKVLPNSQISNIADYTRLVAAISNKYQSRISEGDVESDTLRGCKMLHLVRLSNSLKDNIESSGILRKKKTWRSIDACDSTTVASEFPTLTEDDIRS